MGPAGRRRGHGDGRAGPHPRAQRGRLHRRAGGGRAARPRRRRCSPPRARCSRSTPRSHDAATVGGVMAANDTGPLRHRYGGMRDLVVGATVALSDGTLARSGRQGDQERRRLRPGQAVHGLARHARADRPRRRAAAPAAGRRPRARSARATIPTASARPPSRWPRQPLEADCLDVDWRDGAGRLLVRFGSGAAGDQAAAAVAKLRAAGLEDCAVVEDDDALWMAQRVRQRGACVLKVSGVATDLPAVCRAGGAGRRPARARAVLALAARGGRRGGRRARPAHAARRASCSTRRPSCAPTPGRCPRPGALALMARIKERFDPARIFRPGTFVGGI